MDSIFFSPVFIFFFIIFILVIFGIRFVPEKHQFLTTIFGKYARTLNPGLNVIIPFVEMVSGIQNTKLRKVEDTLTVLTTDPMSLPIPITVYYIVTDTRKFHFDIDGNQNAHIMNRVSASVKRTTGTMSSDDLFTKKEEINDVVKADVEEELKPYGIIITDVIVDEPELPEQVVGSYNNVQAARKNYEAEKVNAEAAKVVLVKEAEARREAAVLYGKGVAEQRAAIINELKQQYSELIQGKNGMSAEAALAVITLASEQDTLREIGDRGNLIIASGSTNDFVARLAALQKEMAANS